VTMDFDDDDLSIPDAHIAELDPVAKNFIRNCEEYHTSKRSAADRRKALTSALPANVDPRRCVHQDDDWIEDVDGLHSNEVNSFNDMDVRIARATKRRPVVQTMPNFACFFQSNRGCSTTNSCFRRVKR